jgi:hypothetical protein
MIDATECPTVLVSEAELAAVYQEVSERVGARAERPAPLPPPFVPAPGEEEWWAKVAAVWDYGGR